MASPPVLTPGGTTGFNITTFRKRAATATYQAMKFIPMIEDYGMKLGTTGTVRKAQRLTTTVLSTTAEGDTLTASNLIDTAATLTAAGNYILVAWSENEKAQTDFAIDTLASGEVERAMGEGSDVIALANVASNSQTLSVPAIDGPTWRQAYSRLGQNTNGMAGPGGEQIYALFSYTQLPALANIPEYNNAEVRGDGENPFVKGVWMRGGGVILDLSTAIYQDANGWHNPMFIREAYQIGWNSEKAQVEQQKYNLQNKVIAFNNFGSGIIHQLRAIDIRTTASQLG